jgi:hypothetical protein
MKVLFVPFSVIGGYVAAFMGKALFSKVWGSIDEEEPPDPKHRDVTWPKLLVASAIEGAVFQLSRAIFERVTRLGFANLTGSWPGPAAPEPRD